MKHILLLLSIGILGGATGFVSNASPISAGQLQGRWSGSLPVPGGSRQVLITVTALPNGTNSALLHVGTAQLKSNPMRVVEGADSVVFYADEVGCRFAGQPVADGQRLRGLWQQPGFRSTLVLERLQATGKQAPAPEAAANAAVPSAQEEVRVASASSPNSEIGLGGTLAVPAGKGPFPAVVLLSDVGAQGSAGNSGKSYSLLNALTDGLIRQGVAVLWLDDRATGRSAAMPSPSSGAELVADAQSALNFLRTRPGIDPARVGLLGHGEGANVALLAAAQAPAPAFVVALGAAGVSGQELLARQSSLVNQPGEPDTVQLARARQEAQLMTLARQEAKKQLAAGATATQVQVRLAQEKMRLATEAKKQNDALYKRQYALLEIIRQTPDNAQAQAIVANMLKQLYPSLSAAKAQTRAGQLTSAWHRAFLTFNPQAELAQVSCPVLLLQGTADAQVPVATNLPPLEKGLKANKHVSIQKLEGLNHGFEIPTSEQALAKGATAQLAASPDALDAVREWLQQQVLAKH